MSARDEDKRLTVPKFSSFKSKEPVKEAGNETDETKSRERERKSRSHRSERHHHSSQRRHESRRHHDRDRHRSRSPKRRDVSRTEPKLVSDRTAVPGVFTIDTKGDPLITKYGGIDRSQIPAYYRHGAGRILGADGRLFIHREGARDQFSIRRPGEGLGGERDGLRSKRLRFAPQPHRLRKRDDDSEKEEDGGFLSVNPKKRKRGQEDASSSEEDNQPSYRSIEGKAKARHTFESESENDSEPLSNSGGIDQDEPQKLKSIQLNRQVKDHPEDIDAWLELVDHQDTLLRAGESLDQKAQDSEAHSYAEIKVSMLESALANTSTPEDRSRVLVYLMREGVKVWNSKTAAKKWSEILKDEDDNFMLWRTRLDFSMSDIATFRYDEVKSMLLGRLSHVLSRSTSGPVKPDVEEGIYVFLRATRFIHDAGYKELAVAAWQGLLELNLFRPNRLDDARSALDAFQDFWESEVPRIGDEDAQGWRSYVQSGGTGDAPEPRMEEKSESTESRDSYKEWGAVEQLRARRAKMPARTMDEGTEDDPFRVVMYSDIESLLFIIPEHLLAEVTPQLIDAFMLFCGLPAAFRSSEWTERASLDQFLTASRDTTNDKPSWEAQVGVSFEDVPEKELPFRRGVAHASISPDLLFSGTGWFRYLPSEYPDRTIDRSWVLATSKQLVHLAQMEGLAPYYMGLRHADDPGNIRKAAKALLKQYPANTQLYYGYALSEYSNGKAEVASNVLASATEVALAAGRPKDLQFWRHWGWLELETGSKTNAIKKLCSSVDDNLRKMSDDGVGVSSAYILKAQRAFLSGFHESVAVRDLEGANAYAECHILLSYLTADGCTEPTSVAQGNISAAISAVDAISQEFKSWGHGTSSSHEGVLQFAARLLYFNASKGPSRRGFMQEKLSRFIDAFPRNTIFLSLFEWSDSSLRVVDETRSLLFDKALSPSQDSVSSRVFAIRHELARGNTNSTKAAFEHALSSDACKASVLLWISYIRFSHSQKELRGKARDVFYRALRHCPWSKEVMMEAFVTLARDMGSEELRAVHETMASKGLRVHVDLEEFLERRKGTSRRDRN